MIHIVNETTALIDKLTLSNIMIEEIIDENALIWRHILFKEENSEIYITESGQHFSSITIKNDGIVNSFKAGSINGIQYCNLSFYIPEKNNLECYSFQQYEIYIAYVQDHLKQAYGIIIDIKNAKIRDIEINRTFALESSFYDYKRIFSYLVHNMPGMRTNSKFGSSPKESETNTYYCRTSSKNNAKKYLEFKIYNKSKHLEEIFHNNQEKKNYCRFEFKLVRWSITAFGSEYWKDLNDEKINKFFDERIQKYIINPYKRESAKRKNDLKKLYKQMKADYSHTWAKKLVQEILNKEDQLSCPYYCFDTEEIIDALKTLPKISIAEVTRYTFKAIRSQTSGIDRYNKRDDLKMKEVIQKLTAK